MGNLVRDNPDAPLNMNKAIVSLWFRIPAETMTAAASDYTANEARGDVNDHGANWIMPGVIPLITWGGQQTDTYYQEESIVACSNDWTTEGIPHHAQTPGKIISGTNDTPTAPSFIGVRSGGPNSGSLVVHLQTAEGCEGSDILNYVTSCVYGTDPPTSDPISYTIEDFTSYIAGLNDYLGNSNQWQPSDAIPDGQQQPSVGAADTWHHLLLSWDLGTSNSMHCSGDPSDGIETLIDTHSMMWCALDDVNKSGTDLPAIWLGMFALGSVDANAMVSSKIYFYPNINSSDEGATLSLNTSTPIPSNPICIRGPALINRDSGTLAPIYKVEMADIQIYAGISTDTSDAANRRLFVSAEGFPVSSAVAAASLGQTPHVLLAGNGLITGSNLGTAGNFTPTGTISVFSGSPHL